MKNKRPIEFYRAITIKTLVPTSLKMYFNQRRRWERGTTKVLWNERKFYAGLFCRPSLLAVSTLIHLSLYIGLLAALMMFLMNATTKSDFIYIIPGSIFVWFVISILKGFWLKATRSRFPLLRYCLFAIVNGLLWTFVTTPARITGFAEGVTQLVKGSNGSFAACSDDIDKFSWLPVD